ncbi:MAG: NAD-dependent deacylase [Vicingaceae bacterium]|nr:NAD-dependent deacylase [Vicingaceae bacterium]
MKKIIVFTGAGISAESGIKTFRDNDGLWENYNIEEVATPEAWIKNPKLVLKFYNERRKQVLKAKPNKAHLDLVKLENKYDTYIITQNIDDLHERAGSSKILHLHGEILKSRSTFNNSTYNIEGTKLNFGDLCENKSQLRPDIVWFGEAVPNMIKAEELCNDADILIIIGTSLSVYPAANILDYVPANCEKYIVDPNKTESLSDKNITLIQKKASTGIPILAKILSQKDSISQ